jgi:hypothetical protein
MAGIKSAPCTQVRESLIDFGWAPAADICPQCGAPDGQPRGVMFGAGIKITRYQCDKCHYHWEEKSPDASTK